MILKNFPLQIYDARVNRELKMENAFIFNGVGRTEHRAPLITLI